MSKKRKIKQLEAQVAELQQALSKREAPKKKELPATKHTRPQHKVLKKSKQAPKTAVNVYLDSNFIKSLADDNIDRYTRRERREIAYENRQRRKDVERYRTGRRGGSKVGKFFKVLFRIIFILIIIAIILAVIGVIVMGITWALVNFNVVPETNQVVGMIMDILRKLFAAITGKPLPML